MDENGFETGQVLERPEEPCVRYIGTATVRTISDSDWENVGAPGTPTKEWGFVNDFLIPVSEFSEEAIAYLRTDDRFVIEG